MEKIAIITGASKGIGKSVALFLAKQKYFVILIARNKENLQEVHDQIINNGGKSEYYTVDVSDYDQVNNCIKNVAEKHEKIDLLFNNAGILHHGTSDVAKEKIDELIKINLNGAIYMANCVAAQMKIQKNGYIINLSSSGGKTAQSFAGLYSASKFGLYGFSEALSKEMSIFNVKVSCLCPSMTATDMTKGRSFPQEEMIQLEDINKTIGYLLSLSPSALPFEITIYCTSAIKKQAIAMQEVVFGLSR